MGHISIMCHLIEYHETTASLLQYSCQKCIMRFTSGGNIRQIYIEKNSTKRMLSNFRIVKVVKVKE